MGYFPMCMDITGRPVILLGNGEQIREKAERLAPFSPRMIRLDRLTESDLDAQPVFVVAGDLDETDAEKAAALCAQRRIPINVVDVPRLCTFSFPSMIVQGDLTVSISTGGKAPGAAACLRGIIERAIPAKTGSILNWLAHIRPEIRSACPPQQGKAILKTLTAESFKKGRPLSEEECAALTGAHQKS